MSNPTSPTPVTAAIPTQIAIMSPGGNNVLYSAPEELLGPVWTANTPPDFTNQGSAFSVNLLSAYLTNATSVTCSRSLAGTGFALDGSGNLTYDGTTVSAAFTCTFTAFSATSLYSVSRLVTLSGAGAGLGADTFPPPVPVQVTVSLNASNQPVVSAWPVSDSAPATIVWSGGVKDYGLWRVRNGGALTLLQRYTPAALGISVGLRAPLSPLDIGSPAVAGSTVQVGVHLVMTGGGTDYFNAADQGQFAPCTVTGPFMAVIKLLAYTGAQEFSKCGLDCRNDTTTGSAHVAAVLCPPTLGGGYQLNSRAVAGGTTTNVANVGGNYTLPLYTMLVRSPTNQNSYAMYTSVDGITFTLLSSVVNALNPQVVVGPFISALAASPASASATFDQWNITQDPQVSFPADTSLSNGDVVQYALDARDLAATPNASAVSGLTAAVTIPTPGGGGSGIFGVKVVGGKLVSTIDNVTPFQLRGCDYSSFETDAPGSTTPIAPQNTTAVCSAAAITGYSNSNLGTYPTYWMAYMASHFKANAVRIPINEASYLRSYTGQDVVALFSNPSVAKQLPDNKNATTSGQYRAAIRQIVADCAKLNMVVILSMHWTAPGPYLGNSQMQLGDVDHTAAAWTLIAQDLGALPHVIFDLFNEPYTNDSQGANKSNPGDVILNGSAQTYMSFGSGTSIGNQHITYAWTSAGYQSMVTAIRGTGATNVILCGGAQAATDLSVFLTGGGTGGTKSYLPVDPLNNLCASWHSYGVSSTSSTVNNALFGGQINPTNIANQLIAQGIPVIIGECGAGDSGSANYATVWVDAGTKGTRHCLLWSNNNWDSTSGLTTPAGAGVAASASNLPTPNSWSAAYYAWMQNHAP